MVRNVLGPAEANVADFNWVDLTLISQSKQTMLLQRVCGVWLNQGVQ